MGEAPSTETPQSPEGMACPVVDQTHGPGEARVAALDAVRGALVLIAFAILMVPPAVQEWKAAAAASDLETVNELRHEEGQSSEPDRRSGPLPPRPSPWSGRVTQAASDLLTQWLAPSAWHGMTLADLVMPGFLFVTGFSAGLSVGRRRRAGETRAAVARHLLLRGLGLFVMGLFLDGGLILDGGWNLNTGAAATIAEIRWLGPVQRIAVCHFATGLLCLFLEGWGRLLVAFFILVNYGQAFETIPAEPPMRMGRPMRPEANSQYSERYNLAADFDRRWLPGRKYFGDWDPCGLLTTLPALALTLIGAAGSSLISRTSTAKSAAGAPVAGLIAAFLSMNSGLVVAEWQPLNASLLTISFVLLVAGVWGLALFAARWGTCFASANRLLAFLGRFGRGTLLLMVALHLIQRVGPRLTTAIAECIGTRTHYLHTLLAALTAVALWSLAPRGRISS